MSKVSIVIVTYNCQDYIGECLLSVLKSDSNIEIIVVDNASSDGSASIVEKMSKEFNSLKLIRLKHNVGFPLANDIALRYARGDIIVFLNPDIKVERGWLKELVKALESDDNIAVAQAKLLLYDEPKKIDSAGGFMDILGHGFHIGRGEADNGQYEGVSDIFYACFAAAAVKRRIIKEVGFLDPKFFLGNEDLDFCWRVRLRGYRVVLAPKSIVYHSVSASVKKVPVLALYHSRKNRLATSLVCYGFKNALVHGSQLIFLYIFASILEIVRKRTWEALTFLSALAWNFRNLRYILAKRKFVQECIRRVSDKDISRYIVQYWVGPKLYLGRPANFDLDRA